MRSQPLYLFQCGESDFYAISDTRWCKRQLPRNLAGSDWWFRRRLSAAEIGAHCFEAARLVADRHICLLRLRTDRFVFECCCPQIAQSLGPDELKTVGQAFDTAWLHIKDQYEDPAAIEDARVRLASAVLAAARDGLVNVAEIKERALSRLGH